MAREPDATDLALRCIELGVRIREELAEALGPAGVTPEQHELLALLARGVTSPGDIVSASGRDKTTVSRLVSRAAAAGLVTQVRATDDRRRQILALTEQGTTVLAQSERILARAAPRTLAALSPRGRRRLEKALRRLRAARGTER